MKSSISSSRELDDRVAKHSSKESFRCTLPVFLLSCAEPNRAKLKTLSIFVRKSASLSAVRARRGLKIVYSCELSGMRALHRYGTHLKSTEPAVLDILDELLQPFVERPLCRPPLRLLLVRRHTLRRLRASITLLDDLAKRRYPCLEGEQIIVSVSLALAIERETEHQRLMPVLVSRNEHGVAIFCDSDRQYCPIGRQ